MRVADILAADDVLALSATDKREVLRMMACPIADHLGRDADRTLHAVLAREAMGSTGVGGGIALPHARFTALARPRGAFARLARPIEFGAIDDLPVDLVFLLLLPSDMPEMQVKSLACVAKRLKLPGLPEQLRRAPDPAAIFRLLVADGED